MKKRLRKKKRLGEFREDCFEIEFSIEPPHSAAEDEAFWDDFIGMIEDRELQFGGGGSLHDGRGCVEVEQQGPVASEHRHAVIDWLAQRPRVTELNAGPLRDANYGWGW
jgi:uncharacterized protein